MIQAKFVERVLKEEGAELHKNQSRAIAKLLHFHSNRLSEGRDMDVDTDEGMDGELSLTMPGYGRVLDIKPKNRTPFKDFKAQRRRKAFPIYNRFVFGHYFTIAYRLMYGLTEEVAEGIREELGDMRI